MGVTHILIDTAKQNIAGFITLRATSLVSEGTDKIKLVEPAIEIAELAVDAKYERQGIGSALIGIAIDVSDELRKKVIGIRHIVVCADKSAIEFYKKLGFGNYHLSTKYCSMFAGALFLNEPMTHGLLFGAVLILVGIRQVTK